MRSDWAEKFLNELVRSEGTKTTTDPSQDLRRAMADLLRDEAANEQLNQARRAMERVAVRFENSEESAPWPESMARLLRQEAASEPPGDTQQAMERMATRFESAMGAKEEV